MKFSQTAVFFAFQVIFAVFFLFFSELYEAPQFKNKHMKRVMLLHVFLLVLPLCGVPQGCIFDQSLFSVLVNMYYDIPAVHNHLKHSL